jgi:hypothetical protein
MKTVLYVLATIECAAKMVGPASNGRSTNGAIPFEGL